MPDVGGVLRGRTFGIPNGVLLVAVAAGIWWFFLRKPKAATTTQAAAAGSQLESGYGLGFAQGQQAAQAQAPSSATGAQPSAGASVSPPVWRYGVPDRTKPYIWRTTSTAIPAGVQPGAIFPGSAGDPASAPGAYPGFGAFSWQWAPVPSGQTDVDYINALRALQGAVAGVGGALARKFHSGSRSTWLHHDAHPLIGAPVKYAHYVRVGGPRTAASHHAAVNRVAAQAGVHPARVAMLNPVPTGLIRIA